VQERDLSIAVNVGLTAAKELTIAALAGHGATVDDYVNTFVSVSATTVEHAIAELKTAVAREGFPDAQPVPGPFPAPTLAAVPDPDPFPPAGFGAPLPQGPAPAPAFVAPPAIPAAAAPPVEEWWVDLFNDFGSWYDNRTDKKNPRAPDFRHKTKTDARGDKWALWISSKDTPAWAKQKLGVA
jgi:hypothetical protein